MSLDRQKTLLLVEDDPVCARSGAALLERAGHTVIPAGTGEGAVTLALANPTIDLVLMDIDLGSGMRGPAAALQILAGRNLPIIFLSSSTDREVLEEIRPITRYGYVSKDSGSAVLLSSIEMACDLFEALENLKEREEGYRSLAENSLDYIMRYDRAGRHLYMNRAALEVTGVTAADMIGKTHRECGFPEEQCAFWEEKIEGVFTTGQPFQAEFDWDSPGGRVTLDWRLSPEFDGNGHVRCVLGVSRDITRRRCKERLVEAWQRLGQLSFHHPLADVLQATLDEAEALTGSTIGFYHFVETDQQTLSLQMWSKNTLDGMCTAAGKGSHYPIAQAGVWVECVAARVPVIHNDYMSLPHRKGLPEGHAPVIRELVVPILRNGLVVAILGVGNKAVDYTADDIGVVERLADLAWDIAARKRTEEALQEREESLAITLHSIGDAVIATDLDGCITRMNPVAERLSGWLFSEAAGRPLSEVFRIVDAGSRESVADPVRKVLESGQIVGMAKHTLLLSRDGAEYQIADSAAPIRDESGGTRGVILVFSDVTERYRVEQALQQSHDLLENLTRLVPGVVYQYRLHPDGRSAFPYASPGMNDIYEVTPDEVREDATAVFGRLHPEDRDRVSAAIMKSADTLAEFFCEFRVVLPRQGLRWRWSQAHPQRMEDGGTLWHGIISDITERKQVEEALRETNEYLENLFNYANAPIIVWDPLFCITRFNHAFETLTGRKAAEVLGQPLEILFPPEQVAASMELIRKTIPGEHWDTVEILIRHIDGPIRTVLWNSATIFSTDGKAPVVTIAQGQDITERKQAEDALRESEFRFESMFRMNMACMFLIDPESGRILDANRASQQFYGYPVAALKKMTIQEINLLPAEDVAVQRQAAANRESTHFVFPHRLADGTVRTVEVYSSPISLKEGPALFSIIHDVTERKQAEESLRVSEEKFSKAFNTSPEAITIASMEDGRFIDVNEVFLAVTGYARETVVGRTSSELNLWIKADDRQRYIETLVAEGFLRNLEVDLRMQNGTIRSFLVSSETVELAGRPCSLNFMTDVTERRQAEEHLHLLEAQLLQEQKLATVGTLADGVAHEINNPLTGVINFAQLIVDRITSAGQAPETAEELRGFAGEIINEGERMASIVRKLLAFSRQEQVRYLPVPPGEVIDAILSLMHKLLEKNEISVVVGLPDNLPLVLCSSPQIQQVLLNLLTNARDALLERWKGYHAEKTVTIDAAILADSEGHWVRISVADRGNGIPPEIAARIFDPFFTTKPRERGTGLGLSISYGIVKEHGGRLSFETRPGKGTVFHLDLPEAGASDTPASMRGAPGA